MKVVIVNSSDLYGGAARAAYRLHRSLLHEGIDSTMVVQKKVSDDYTVIGPTSRFRSLLEGLRPALDHIIMKVVKCKVLFSSSYLPFSSIVDKVNELHPDIVHLHWVTGGTLRIEDLKKIKAPIVWSCHDMWPFTGGCHYDMDCGRFNDQCGNCKILDSNREHDLSRRVFNRKLATYAKIEKLSIICSSQWLTTCAKDSTLFGNREISTLPNCIDTKLFKPMDRNLVKDIFNIPKDKKVILFGAMNSLSDPRKGSNELFKAINLLDVDNVIFVIAGSSRPQESLALKYPVYFIPPLNDEVSLPLMYNVADVMIVPSIQENLANSIVESLACGVPVVAFNIGGNKDMINHKKNGYLSEAFDPQDMAFGIKWVIENQDYSKLSNNARDRVLNDFDSRVVSKKHIHVYKNILGSK